MRLSSLLRSLRSRPEVEKQYQQTIDKCIQKEYIPMAPNQEVKDDGDNKWFLPHFSVIHEERETTKVRITFDAVAKTDGIAFNECMHAGPALQNNLVN